MAKTATTKNGRVDFGAILMRPKKLAVEWDDLTIHIEYNRAALSHAELREIMARPDDAPPEPDKDRDIEYLLKQLVAWDIEENGLPMPLNEASLNKFPERLLGAIGRAIREDLYPNLETATA